MKKSTDRHFETGLAAAVNASRALGWIALSALIVAVLPGCEDSQNGQPANGGPAGNAAVGGGSGTGVGGASAMGPYTAGGSGAGGTINTGGAGGGAEAGAGAGGAGTSGGGVSGTAGTDIFDGAAPDDGGGGFSGGTGDTGGTGGTGGAAGAAGGAGAGGNGGTEVCDLPSSFSWSSTGPLITPKPPAGHDFVSIKDPTIVFYDGKYHLFATAFDAALASRGWKSVYLSFTDLSGADAAPQSYMGDWATGNTVAPQVFYFRPHDKWYLIFQWNARYSTNDDINNPNGWSAPAQLLSGEPNGALDFWVICDDATCYLFFSADDGNLYLSKTAIGNFPAFSGYEIIMSDTRARLFEACNVYKVEGMNKYLLLVEAYGPRYFRSWTASTLDGPWTALADEQSNPFAGEANVTFEGADWTNDISHGEMIRAGYDETMTVNACYLQFLYQGVDPNASVSEYGLLPYRLGLLTANYP